MKGPLLLLPNVLRPRLRFETEGMPQLCGSGVENGSPNSFTTSRFPAYSYGRVSFSTCPVFPLTSPVVLPST